MNPGDAVKGPLISACGKKAKEIICMANAFKSVHIFFGVIAQLGERCVRNAEVVGSNPIGSTK